MERGGQRTVVYEHSCCVQSVLAGRVYTPPLLSVRTHARPLLITVAYRGEPGLSDRGGDEGGNIALKSVYFSALQHAFEFITSAAVL